MSTQTNQRSVGRAPNGFRRGLALFTFVAALLSMTGSAFASSAFLATSYPATVNGVSTSAEQVGVNLGGFECGETKLSGTFSAPTKTLSLSPEWSKCAGPLAPSPQTVFKANGCKFELKPTTNEVAVGPAGCGPITIVRPPISCEVQIPSQTGLATTFKNSGSGAGARVLVNVNASIKYKTCNGEFSDGRYIANWELAGSTGGGGSNPISVTNSFEIAPTVKTGLTQNVKSGSAQLAGSVNPNFLSTTYQFEYGTTAAYGSKAPASPASAGSGGNSVAVSQGLSGLSANTVYHYRLAATNSQGTTYGKNRTFKTITGGATDAELLWSAGTTELTASGSSATQKWTVNTGGISCQEVTGNVTDTAGTGASSVAVENLSYHDKGKTTCIGPYMENQEMKTNGCPYEFHFGELVKAGEAKGSVTIGKCISGESMVTSNPWCTIVFPQYQTPTPVIYKTVGSNVEVEMSMTNMDYITVGGLCGAVTASNGKYSGKILLKGNNGNLSIG